MTIRCQFEWRAISLRTFAVFVASLTMFGLLLTLAAVLAGVLGAWRLGADAGWTSNFIVGSGLFSRYQIWFAVAIAAQASAFTLNRWVTNQNTNIPALAPEEA